MHFSCVLRYLQQIEITADKPKHFCRPKSIQHFCLWPRDNIRYFKALDLGCIPEKVNLDFKSFMNTFWENRPL